MFVNAQNLDEVMSFINRTPPKHRDRAATLATLMRELGIHNDDAHSILAGLPQDTGPLYLSCATLLAMPHSVFDYFERLMTPTGIGKDGVDKQEKFREFIAAAGMMPNEQAMTRIGTLVIEALAPLQKATGLRFSALMVAGLGQVMTTLRILELMKEKPVTEAGKSDRLNLALLPAILSALATVIDRQLLKDDGSVDLSMVAMSDGSPIKQGG